MSGEDYNTNYNPMIEQMMAMLSNLSNNVMTNVNSLNADMNKNNQDFNEKFEAIHAKIAPSQDCPQDLLQEQCEKLPEFELPLETPRGQYPQVQVSMTDIFRDAKAANDFAEVNLR